MMLLQSAAKFRRTDALAVRIAESQADIKEFRATSQGDGHPPACASRLCLL